MGISFQKKIPLGSGLSLNFSKTGISFSLKVPGIGSLNLRDGRVTFSGSKAGLRVRKTLTNPKVKKGGKEEVVDKGE